MASTLICPACNKAAEFTFFKKREKYVCSECEEEFDALPKAPITPQTIFLSYAHKSENAEDYDISEDLVWLIKEELSKDGHSVWIDHEGIRGGTQWRERITDAITSHKHFLAFLSKRSVRQEPNVCLNEVAIAIKHNRIIQTILTEPENQVSAPLTLSSIQWHKFSDWKDIKEGKKTGPKGEDWNAWFGSLMAEIRQNLADITYQKAVGELSELKEILKPTSFDAAIIKSVEGFFGRQWLFDATNDWFKTDNRLFWLKGTPGIGKSSFAAKLVHSGNSSIVGFFKCDFQGLKSAEESASECIRTLAYQLASRLPDYRIKLLRGQQLEQLALEIKNLQNQERKTPDDLFTYLITEPLNRSEKIAEASRLALVIDALDEAGRLVNGKMVNPLADLLYKHADQLPPWLGVIVTSRPEAYLQQQLGTKFSPLIMEGGTQNNLEDIKDYLETKLDPAITGEQRDKTIQTIIDKSGGTFLYIKRVEQGYDLSKPETLPNGLDDLFYKDFERYFPDPRQYEDKTEKFLRLLVAAPGPLPKQMAQELLQWQARDITQYVTQPMASLLTETEEGLQFFHKSIKDWLQDGTRSGIYQVNDDGPTSLCNFLWFELNKYKDANNQIGKNPWQKQILEWLPDLSVSTEVEGMEFVVIDVETTGLGKRNAGITKIDAVKISNNTISYSDIFSQYVNPGIFIPKEIEEFTGITNEMVKSAPSIEVVIPELYEFVKGCILVSHNATFSAGFLEEAANSSKLGQINLPWLCTLKLSRVLFKGKSCSLRSICEYLAVEIEDPPNYPILEAKCFLKLKKLLGARS